MRVIERHKIIRGTYDVKATLIGGDHVRFKAEVDIDGTELTLRYLETLPLDKLLKVIFNFDDHLPFLHFLN